MIGHSSLSSKEEKKNCLFRHWSVLFPLLPASPTELLSFISTRCSSYLTVNGFWVLRKEMKKVIQKEVGTYWRKNLLKFCLRLFRLFFFFFLFSFLFFKTVLPSFEAKKSEQCVIKLDRSFRHCNYFLSIFKIKIKY